MTTSSVWLDEVEGFQCLPPVVDGEAQGCPVVAVELLGLGEPGLLEQPRAFGTFPGIDLGVHPRVHEPPVCAGVAVSNWSANTWRVSGSRRASPMIRSIIAPVDARRRLVSGLARSWVWSSCLPSCHRPAA